MYTCTCVSYLYVICAHLDSSSPRFSTLLGRTSEQITQHSQLHSQRQATLEIAIYNLVEFTKSSGLLLTPSEVYDSVFVYVFVSVCLGCYSC